MPDSSMVSTASTAPYFQARSMPRSRASALAVTEFSRGTPTASRSPRSSTVGSSLSTERGRDDAASATWIAFPMARIRSISGSPTFTSSSPAPAAVWSRASARTVV